MNILTISKKNILFAAIIGAAFLVSFAAVTPYKIGDKVADFSLKNVNGKMVSMADNKNAKGYIVVFTCNHCPFAKKYWDRLNLLNKKYEPKGFPLFAISCNDAGAVPEDAYPNMALKAKEEKSSFPYLYDSTQAVARSYGAMKTPEAYVLFKENGKWILKYSGAIDDNGGEADKVKEHYVENAVDELLSNKPVSVTQTKSVGCGMKWLPQ